MKLNKFYSDEPIFLTCIVYSKDSLAIDVPISTRLNYPVLMDILDTLKQLYIFQIICDRRREFCDPLQYACSQPHKYVNNSQATSFSSLE